jgi:hypothetical protein
MKSNIDVTFGTAMFLSKIVHSWSLEGLPPKYRFCNREFYS